MVKLFILRKKCEIKKNTDGKSQGIVIGENIVGYLMPQCPAINMNGEACLNISCLPLQFRNMKRGNVQLKKIPF